MQSCIRKESSNASFKDVPIIIDINSVKKEPLKLSYIQYIPLETSEECLIGYADKTLIWNNRIYVADFTNAMALFVFDMNGKFLFKIAKRGQGPGEYIKLHDFDIQVNGDIYMLDQHTKKILIYDPEGEYLHEIHSDYYFSFFCLVSNKMYRSRLVKSGKMFAELAVYDMADKKTEYIIKDEKFLHGMGLMNFSTYRFYYSPDSIMYYSPKFSEIIYSINEDGIRPAIGIKNLKMPPEHIINEWLRVKNPYERSELIQKSNYFIENVYIYETDEYISLNCVRDFFSDIVLYKKNSKSACIIVFYEYFSKIGIDNVKGSTGKEFFGVIAFDSDNESHKKILESRAELANWKKDDNPVIVLFNPDI
jgi:hypothetical protein